MSGTTAELNLATAVDADDNADYLTIALANSLRTVDALFNNVTGHSHSGAHQGGPIGSVPSSALPALGGDLAGTVPAGTVSLRNNSAIAAHDTSGTAKALLGLMSDNNVWFTNAGGGSIRFINGAGNVEIAHIDNSGNFYAEGSVLAGGNVTVTGGTVAVGAGGSLLTDATNLFLRTNGQVYIQNNAGGPQSLNSGDIYASRGNGSGFVYLGGSGHYIGYDGVAYTMPASALNLGGTLNGAGNINAQGVAGSYAFNTANSPNPYGQGYANAWINASSADFKENVAPIDDPVAIVLNPALHGVQYDHTWELPAIEGIREEPLMGTTHSIGFVADEWLPWVPEIVATDASGKPEGMDYARVAAILFEALKQYIAQTDGRLDKLEEVVKPA